MCRVTLSPSAKRDLKNVKIKKGRTVISYAIEELKIDPFVGKPLGRELMGQWSYSLNGYRIIYFIRKMDKMVDVLRIRLRQTAYN